MEQHCNSAVPQWWQLLGESDFHKGEPDRLTDMETFDSNLRHVQICRLKRQLAPTLTN